MVRAGDMQWASLMHWVVFALIQAEEAGITHENVAERAQGTGDGKS
ncbi:MAG TPA: hypothetical protein VNZ61_05610 [Roseomonas sp.]|nr:hypothetical protein [Roseomonas sp.]